MKPGNPFLVKEGGIAKGDVLAVSQVAGIMGAKKNSGFNSHVSPLMLSGIDMAFYINEKEVR
jgi:cyclic pyranopterin phosphate synthase